MRPGADRNATPWASKRPTALEWTAAVLVALVAFLYFVVAPLAEVAVRGALGTGGAIVQAIAQGVAAIAQSGYDEAQARIENDPLVIAMLGEGVVCQPVGEATFESGQATDEFRIAFDVVGPRGRAKAAVVVRVTDTHAEVASITVTSDQQSVQVPVGP